MKITRLTYSTQLQSSSHDIDNYFFEKKQFKFRFPTEPIRDTQNSNWNFFRKKFEAFIYLPKRASVNVIQIHRARDSTVEKLEKKKKKEIRQKIR